MRILRTGHLRSCRAPRCARLGGMSLRSEPVSVQSARKMPSMKIRAVCVAAFAVDGRQAFSSAQPDRPNWEGLAVALIRLLISSSNWQDMSWRIGRSGEAANWLPLVARECAPGPAGLVEASVLYILDRTDSEEAKWGWPRLRRDGPTQGMTAR